MIYHALFLGTIKQEHNGTLGNDAFKKNSNKPVRNC
jgi:hypothetical protein